MNEEYEDFISKAKENYANYKSTLENDGIVSKLPESRDGYYICLKYSDEVASKFASLSNEISKRIKGIVYDSSKIHTSITYIIVEGGDFPDDIILEKMDGAVKKSAQNLSVPKLDFKEVAIGNDSVIAMCLPDENFFNLTKSIVKNCNDLGLDFKMPWASHISLYKFEENGNQEVVDYIKDKISQFNFPKYLTPIAIELGHFTYNSSNGFIPYPRNLYTL